MSPPAQPKSPPTWHPRLRAGVLAAALTLPVVLIPVGTDKAAEIYRWVDENGVTVYSRQPPAQGAATPIRPAPGPGAADTERAEQRIRTLIEQDLDKREEAARQAEESAKRSREQEARSANCRAARANLETIENLGARRLRMPDGDYRYLSDGERVKLAQEARGQIRESCD